ncbi:CAX-interacting protein 4-like [Prosopis cineraria]|uniref:CAX-interacting protein 4-like n=1 Tax=Prosopis cineraria TaxID=364024 RepID=UPI00240EB3EC|nr:CAX-interacting protein 4-like [Prosopis cineraria]
MPATAGRVRMPANNRVHSSAALQTHGIWQSAIGYDPYAPNKEDKKDTSEIAANAEPDAENAYASFQGLLALAKISNSNVDVDRGCCKKCGRVGHLKFQCKNYVKVKDDNEEKDAEAMQVPALIALDKLKGRAAKVERSTVKSSDESDEEDESESSDSEVDSEIERIIAERSGKKINKKGGSSRKRKDSDEDESDSGSGKRKKRGRSKRRHGKREISDSDSDDSDLRKRKRRREHRRKRGKSSAENYDRKHRRKSRKEKRRRRSCRSDSDSETSEDSGRRHRRRTRKAESSTDTDPSDLDDSRMGRDLKKSAKGRRHHSEDDE